mmetsp:Transcript_38183/g.113403  ORF Transcript_38183/g.113403 Transcript_38183/m.113403 type:complete len:261 (-) Transcript_38183:599-1381(-)
MLTSIPSKTCNITGSPIFTASCNTPSPAKFATATSALLLKSVVTVSGERLWTPKRSAVQPQASRSSMGAGGEASRSIWTASAPPLAAAHMRDVRLSLSFMLMNGCMPSASSSPYQSPSTDEVSSLRVPSTTVARALLAARCCAATCSASSASSPSSIGSAPCCTRTETNSMESCSAAHISGVQPCSSCVSTHAPSSMASATAPLSFLTAASRRRRFSSSARTMDALSARCSAAWSMAVRPSSSCTRRSRLRSRSRFRTSW